MFDAYLLTAYSRASEATQYHNNNNTFFMENVLIV